MQSSIVSKVYASELTRQFVRETCILPQTRICLKKSVLPSLFLLLYIFFINFQCPWLFQGYKNISNKNITLHHLVISGGHKKTLNDNVTPRHHVISGGHKKMSELDPRLICPFFDVFLPFLPESFRRRMRCGIKHGDVSMAANIMV
jgi:hypothetical protein